MISDPGFGAARKAGSRGIGRVVLPLVFLGFLALVAQPITSGGSTISRVVVGAVALVALFILVTEIGRRVRNRTAWNRAAGGAVSLTLRGDAVAKRRTVSGRPMRTVVVERDGRQRYVHLLFATKAPADTMRQGPVTLEFFAGDDIEGPTRLLLPDGRTLWAFTSRLGDEAEPRRAATADSSSDGSAALIAPGVMIGSGPQVDGQHRDEDRDRDGDGFGDGSGDGFGDSAWSGGDGWTGGSSWGSDSTWSGSDGASSSSSNGSGGGGGGSWFSGDGGGGWSGGDSGGGSGGDSGGGGGS